MIGNIVRISEPLVDVSTELYRVLLVRKDAYSQESYVASLYEKGVDAITKKIGEESFEVVIAISNLDLINNADNDYQHLTHELADLWFHTLVLMAYLGINPAEDVFTRFDFYSPEHVEDLHRLYESDSPTLLKEFTSEITLMILQIKKYNFLSVFIKAEVTKFIAVTLMVLTRFGAHQGMLSSELKRRFGTSGIAEKASRTN